jgi:hypothetical protein
MSDLDPLERRPGPREESPPLLARRRRYGNTGSDSHRDVQKGGALERHRPDSRSYAGRAVGELAGVLSPFSQPPRAGRR